MTDILFSSAAEVALLLRRREISSRELTELLLARIDEVNPAVNAVVELDADAALRAADAADDAILRADELGPLHGIPMTIKDSFDVAGMRTTWGNPAFKDFVADADATVVTRLRRAGAIIVGKTNVHFMLADYGQTANELFGATNNPWDLSRTPGGSTGGGAAGLAAGLTFLEYGSDVVGSIRIPAGFCGVFGLKPSAEVVPLTGFQPPGPPAPGAEFSRMRYMSAVGPLARSAGDLRTALLETAGPEGVSSRAYHWTLPPARHRRLSDFRVGVLLDDASAPVASDVGAVLSNCVDALNAAGATIVPGWPDEVNPRLEYETFGYHVGLFFAFAEPGSDFPAITDFVVQENRRMVLRAAWSRYFQDVDVFLCPANFTAAFPHDSRPFPERTISTPEGERPYDNQPFWVSHASVVGLPAVVAPVGLTRGGLPVGAQIIGPMYEDDTAITFAELLGDVVGGYQRPPV
jgi:amidase